MGGSKARRARRRSPEGIAARIGEIVADPTLVRPVCCAPLSCELVDPADPVLGGDLPRFGPLWRCPTCGAVEYVAGPQHKPSGIMAQPDVVRIRARVVRVRTWIGRHGKAAVAAEIAPVGAVGSMDAEAATAALVALKRVRRACRKESKEPARSA